MHTKQQIKERKKSEMVAFYMISQKRDIICVDKIQRPVLGINCSILISLYTICCCCLIVVYNLVIKK